MRRLLIIGCGDVMRRTLPQLVRRWRVIALVRRRDPALAALGVTQIEGDLDQPQTLARLSGIADAVIHSAPPPTEGKGDPRTARLLALLQRGKSLPRRLIYISTSGVYGDCGGAWVDETRAVDGKVGARGTARRCRSAACAASDAATAGRVASASCARRASTPATACRWSDCGAACR
jgi:nucleoside-diphosphate-sugar epimerase